jgi:hypothetical protein
VRAGSGQLKIVFVCGCLEPGLDGVGDYTRLLASQLAERGHTCSLVSVIDPHITSVTRDEVAATPRPMSVLRIPATAPWPERIAQAKAAREQFAPDWISFQFVPYAYDPRGLCFGLGAHFQAIAGDCPAHIMFHEIWIGEAEGVPFKNKMMGKLQRYILKDLLQKLRPRVIHTHTPLYRHLLGKLGVEAKLLPLFANIPCPPGAVSDPEWLAEKWPAGWGRMHVSGRENWWVFVLFGSIHPEWDADYFRRRATETARQAGKSCAFISIGRAGAEGDRILQGLRRDESASWMMLNLGPQSPADISQCLLEADFGVSPVPPEYLTKSGTTMAMLEHGLPVIVTRPAYRYRNCPPQLLEPEMKNVITHFELGSVRRGETRQSLPQITEQFVADLRAG